MTTNNKKRHAWYEACYVDFDSATSRVVFVQHKWLLGMIFLLFFSPLFYCLFFDQQRFTCPLWVAWLAGGFLFFIGGGLVAHFRRCHFNLATGQFRYYSGFLVTYRVIHGQTADIQGLELSRFESFEGAGKRRCSQTLSLLCQGRSYPLAEGGPGAKVAVARRLAKAIGCPLTRDGTPEEL